MCVYSLVPLAGMVNVTTLNLGRIASDQELVQQAERRARAPPSVKASPVRQTAPGTAAAHNRRPPTPVGRIRQPSKLPAVRPEHWADDASALLFACTAASSTSSWPPGPTLPPGPEHISAERSAHNRASTPPAAWVARHKECLRRQTSHWSRSGERASRSGERAATPLGDKPPRLISSSHAATRGGASALMSGASAPLLDRRPSPPRTAAADARRPHLSSDFSSDRPVSPSRTVAIDARRPQRSSDRPDSPPRTQTAAADARRPRVSSESLQSSSSRRPRLSSGRPVSPPRTATADARRPQLSSGRPDSPPWRPHLSKDRPASPPRSQTAAADARRPRFSKESLELGSGQEPMQPSSSSRRPRRVSSESLELGFGHASPAFESSSSRSSSLRRCSLHRFGAPTAGAADGAAAGNPTPDPDPDPYPYPDPNSNHGRRCCGWAVPRGGTGCTPRWAPASWPWPSTPRPTSWCR